MDKYLLTYALPYANGSLHLGHMAGFVHSDIYHRAQQMQKRIGYFICGNDAHGTPIMLSARKQGISPEEQVAQFHKQHRQDLTDFAIALDNFSTTDTEYNKSLVENIYSQLVANGDIECRVIEQLFDNEKNMFLPDRFIKGTCPKCKATDQYGDNCEACGATYDPTELINPKSVLSDTTPVMRATEHYFFKLSKHQDVLQNWVQSDNHVPEQLVNKMQEWFKDGLKDWDISRDAPYFGFKIPGTVDKYFYVWLDAPVGYLSSFLEFCEKNSVDFAEFTKPDSKTKMYNAIGKDIFYFHTLFWPAILNRSNYKMPDEIVVHGFLTINGAKMSKSRGTFITARKYLDNLSPSYLRYYLASKLSNNIEDIDLNLTDFMQKTNSDLVGKFVNIASRCANFICKLNDNNLSTELIDANLYNEWQTNTKQIIESYNTRNFAQAVRQIMYCADQINQFIDAKQPWVLAKEANQHELAVKICTQGINGFRLLCIYLKPIIPELITKAEEFLNINDLSMQDADTILLNHKINIFKPLLQRIQQEDIDKIMENNA
jgi:methionyl-tRNA synthetase